MVTARTPGRRAGNAVVRFAGLPPAMSRPSGTRACAANLDATLEPLPTRLAHACAVEAATAIDVIPVACQQ